ncbi:alginate lyase [Saccharobesus litoralis]|uniref:Alginate lyase n=2 Tax=Saccharobesus litoralis TaxID=2172099 RepID=A0A2S0VXE6_9ALTE|nr:polysaccharide lyase 6 family protein [Saccharobesus litoralis]AWB68896.1 alginate lyase [Saccharobesus litoralis]
MQFTYLWSFLFVALFAVEISAKEYLVKSQAEYQQVSQSLKAGDTVVLANGEWRNFEIVFTGKGKKGKPISLVAQTKGKVTLTGQSNLRLGGEYLHVEGLVFKNGFTPTGEVIAYRVNKQLLAHHSRVTQVVIDNYSNPDRFEADYWVAMFGKHNRFDHSHLVGKRNKGVTMAVRLNTEESRENYHQIDHNYFGPRPIFGSNGGETLRIGTSHFSLSNSFTVVENNYFDRCNGEVEIISIKSGKNQVRNNVFFESRGTLTMRHGNGNIIENNVFFGNGVDHTGGIRVINAEHMIRNNYMEGLTGYRFGSGFTVMNGVPNSPINRYHQVNNVTITQNSFINLDHIHFAAGADAERSAPPINSQFSNNLVFNQNNQDPFSLFDDISGISFKGNAYNQVSSPKISQGFSNQVIKVKRAANGLLYPTNLTGVGADKSLKPIAKQATGVSWYEKTEPEVAFDSGKTLQVTPGYEQIFSALSKAKSGDTLSLAAGHYVESKKIQLDKVISIVAATKGQVTIEFLGTSLFVIANNGSLRLVGLTINGKEAPDYSGNALIRTAKWGMYKNYRLSIEDTQISDLDVNHSFSVFDSGARAFASQITIKNSVFNNITGDILRLNKEADDLGIYNAEYVTLSNNQFSDVQGALAKIYRGGRDESTFGPHLDMQGNVLSNVGKGKRNKSKSAVYLHGVQVTNIANNTVENSAGVVIEHTVGEPISVVQDNSFKATPAPSVVELHTGGAHTAQLKNNKVL